jgi:hypothetical protein
MSVRLLQVKKIQRLKQAEAAATISEVLPHQSLAWMGISIYVFDLFVG